MNARCAKPRRPPKVDESKASFNSGLSTFRVLALGSGFAILNEHPFTHTSSNSHGSSGKAVKFLDVGPLMCRTVGGGTSLGSAKTVGKTEAQNQAVRGDRDRKSTRLNSSHANIS